MGDNGQHTLKSAGKLFRILEYVLEEGRADSSSVTQATGLNRSTVHVHLQTLRERGMLVQDENDVYYPCLKLLSYGEQARYRIPFYQKGKAEVDELAEETGELVNMAYLQGNRVYLMYISEGERAVHNHLPGKGLPVYASAVGKAVLAHLPSNDLDDILNQIELTKLTEATITDESVLRNELEQIESQGYAVDDEEGGEGIRCIAAPVCPGVEAVGAVSITGPAQRIGSEYQESLQRKITNLANVVEVKLRYDK